MAFIVVAVGVMLTSATGGNLFFFVTFLLAAIAMVIFSRLAR
jgi:hypothetical protein